MRPSPPQINSSRGGRNIVAPGEKCYLSSMSLPTASEREVPGLGQALVFQAKATGLRLRRLLEDGRSGVSLHRRGTDLIREPIVGEAVADLWNHRSPAEFPLTAGKVENLRIAARRLDGVEVPGGALFSFWRQVGRTTRRRGYRAGRELREGCLIPNRGGGLCQLSNLLYGAALDAGLEIVERHAHSRIIPGSLAERDRDATVFWNYVDLRFRSPDRFRIEVTLNATQLVVRLRSGNTAPAPAPHPRAPVPSTGTPQRSAPSGDCLTCGMTSCFRHPSATSRHGPSSGHTAFLLDERWPEFQSWCERHTEAGDRWLVPLDGKRWNKANYGWQPPEDTPCRFASATTLVHAIRQRRLPAQGAIRQRALLARDRALAAHYARLIDPEARHLIVAQNLLPHLWRDGVLGGRSFDVLMTRWPLRELQRRLDEARQHHPESSTLSDFRADPALVSAEEDALTAASRVLTPHRALAAHFGERALQLDWTMPEALPTTPAPDPFVLFPASPLGRKGIHALASAMKQLETPLHILGQAREDEADPLAAIESRTADRAALSRATVVVLPAWIEHRPRLLLQALANGTPVIATKACGLPTHPLLTELVRPDAGELQAYLADLLRKTPSQHSLAS